MIKKGSKVLITGGAGFIGSHVARAVMAAGATVRILDDFSSGKRERLLGMPYLDLIQGDVRDPEVIRGALVGADAVIHLAMAPVGSDPTRALQVNLGGTLNLLDAVKDLEKRARPRMVLCSSGSVYGKQKAFVLHEELAARPATTDAVTAVAIENYGHVYRELHGVPVSSLRLFRCFGPDEDPERRDSSVVSRFVRAALDGTSPAIFGDGQQTRDLIYIENAVAGIIAALDAEPDVYNIAQGEAVQINFLWTLVLDLAGKRRRTIEPTYVPAPSWEPKHARPQIAKACRSMSCTPSVKLRDGLARTVRHYQSLRDTDPNAWFTPPTSMPMPRLLSATQEIEVSDEDLVPDDDLDAGWTLPQEMQR